MLRLNGRKDEYKAAEYYEYPLHCKFLTTLFPFGQPSPCLISGVSKCPCFLRRSFSFQISTLQQLKKSFVSSLPFEQTSNAYSLQYTSCSVKPATMNPQM